MKQKLILIRFKAIQIQMSDEAPVDIEVGNEDVTALNEQLVNQLRILNYEKDYIQKGSKAINTATFSFSTNPTEQFNTFKNLVKYLLQLNDVSADYSKFDEPMTVSGNIIKECQKLNIPCEFPPLKLKTGSGEFVLLVLNGLANRAMKKKNFNFKKPVHEKTREVEEQGEEEEKPGDENDEMIDQAEMFSDDEMEEKEQVGAAILDEQKQIIHSAVNENDWKLECERVANKLKIPTNKTDTKEWRAHVESTKSCNENIKKNFPKSRLILEKLNDELTRSLETISKSEKMINSNMSEIGEQYRSQSEELKKMSAHFNNLSASMKEMNESYRLVGEKLEQIQAKTTETTDVMSDSSPVVKIKESLKNLTAEIKTMDVRMGVLNHTILKYKSKQKNKDLKFKNLQAEEFDEFQ